MIKDIIQISYMKISVVFGVCPNPKKVWLYTLTLDINLEQDIDALCNSFNLPAPILCNEIRIFRNWLYFRGLIKIPVCS